MSKENNLQLSLDPQIPVEAGSASAGRPEEAGEALRSGDVCPQCKTGRLEYDGLLNLACPECGYSLGGCFT